MVSFFSLRLTRPLSSQLINPRDAWKSVEGTTKEEAWTRYVAKFVEVIYHFIFSNSLTFIIGIDPDSYRRQ